MTKSEAKHVIAVVRYSGDGSWIECACGESVSGPTPEAVAEGFQRHRQEMGLSRGEYVGRPDGSRYDFRITKEGLWT